MRERETERKIERDKFKEGGRETDRHFYTFVGI